VKTNGGLHKMMFGLAAVLFSMSLAAAGSSATAGKVDSCTLLTKAEIQEAIGKPVKDGKPNPNANPAVGIPCEFGIDPYGAVSILAVEATASYSADKIMAGLKKMNIPVTDAPGIGDKSFFADMGYGMLQLNTWKGAHYLILTVMIPGATEAQQKAAAGKLMTKVLGRL
jgi:hypothetical protein